MGPRDEAPESDRTQWYAEPRRDQRSHEKPFWEREREREYRRENGLRYDQYIPQRRHSSDRDGAEQNAPIMRRDSDHSFQTEAPRGPRRDDRMNRRRASEYFDEPKAKTSFGTNMWVSKEYAAKHQLQPNGEPLSPDVAPERLTAPAKDQAPQPSSRLIHQQSRSEPQLHLNSTSGLAAAAGTNIHATTTTAQNDGSSNIADGAATAEPMEMDLDDRAPAPAPPPLRLRTTDLSHISHTKHAFTPKSARNRGAQSTEDGKEAPAANTTTGKPTNPSSGSGMATPPSGLSAANTPRSPTAKAPFVSDPRIRARQSLSGPTPRPALNDGVPDIQRALLQSLQEFTDIIVQSTMDQVKHESKRKFYSTKMEQRNARRKSQPDAANDKVDKEVQEAEDTLKEVSKSLELNKKTRDKAVQDMTAAFISITSQASTQKQGSDNSEQDIARLKEEIKNLKGSLAEVKKGQPQSQMEELRNLKHMVADLKKAQGQGKPLAEENKEPSRDVAVTKKGDNPLRSTQPTTAHKQEKRIHEHDKRLYEIDKRIKEHDKRFDRLDNHVERLNTQEKRIFQVEEQLKAETERVNGHEKRMEHTEKRASGHERRMNEDQKRRDDDDKRLSAHGKRADGLEQRLGDIEEDSRKMKRKLPDVEVQPDRVASDIRKHTESIDTIKKDIALLRGKVLPFEATTDDWTKRMASFKEELDTLKNDVNQVRSSSARNKAIESLEQQLTTLKNGLDQVRSAGTHGKDMISFKRELTTFKDDLDTIRSTTTKDKDTLALKQDLATVKDDLYKIRSTTSGNMVDVAAFDDSSLRERLDRNEGLVNSIKADMAAALDNHRERIVACEDQLATVRSLKQQVDGSVRHLNGAIQKYDAELLSSGGLLQATRDELGAIRRGLTRIETLSLGHTSEIPQQLKSLLQGDFQMFPALDEVRRQGSEHHRLLQIYTGKFEDHGSRINSLEVQKEISSRRVEEQGERVKMLEAQKAGPSTERSLPNGVASSYGSQTEGVMRSEVSDRSQDFTRVNQRLQVLETYVHSHDQRFNNLNMEWFFKSVLQQMTRQYPLPDETARRLTNVEKDTQTLKQTSSNDHARETENWTRIAQRITEIEQRNSRTAPGDDVEALRKDLSAFSAIVTPIASQLDAIKPNMQAAKDDVEKQLDDIRERIDEYENHIAKELAGIHGKITSIKAVENKMASHQTSASLKSRGSSKETMGRGTDSPISLEHPAKKRKRRHQVHDPKDDDDELYNSSK